jgi:hypothetical protein
LCDDLFLFFSGVSVPTLAPGASATSAGARKRAPDADAGPMDANKRTRPQQTIIPPQARPMYIPPSVPVHAPAHVPVYAPIPHSAPVSTIPPELVSILRTLETELAGRDDLKPLLEHIRYCAMNQADAVTLQAAIQAFTVQLHARPVHPHAQPQPYPYAHAQPQPHHYQPIPYQPQVHPVVPPVVPSVNVGAGEWPTVRPPAHLQVPSHPHSAPSYIQPPALTKEQQFQIPDTTVIEISFVVSFHLLCLRICICYFSPLFVLYCVHIFVLLYIRMNVVCHLTMKKL